MVEAISVDTPSSREVIVFLLHSHSLDPTYLPREHQAAMPLGRLSRHHRLDPYRSCKAKLLHIFRPFQESEESQYLPIFLLAEMLETTFGPPENQILQTGVINVPVSTWTIAIPKYTCVKFQETNECIGILQIQLQEY